MIDSNFITAEQLLSNQLVYDHSTGKGMPKATLALGVKAEGHLSLAVSKIIVLPKTSYKLQTVSVH